jgi:hypothetical protein
MGKGAPRSPLVADGAFPARTGWPETLPEVVLGQPQTLSRIKRVTVYGSQLALGRRSSA